jgi:hypothetical protein
VDGAELGAEIERREKENFLKILNPWTKTK